MGQSEVSRSGLSVRFLLLASDRVNMGMSEVAGGTSPRRTGASEARPSAQQDAARSACLTVKMFVSEKDKQRNNECEMSVGKIKPCKTAQKRKG